MSLSIEIFRSDDYVPDGEIPLLPLLREAIADVLGPDPAGIVIELYFYAIADATPYQGSPELTNLRASHGYVRVRVLRDSSVLYQHPHPLRELIGEPLREVLRQRDPDVIHWGYGVRGPGLEGIPLMRPAPRVTHEMRSSSGSWPKLRLSVEEVADPEPPEAALADFGAPADESGEEPERDEPQEGPPVTVVAPAVVVDSFTRTLPFSGEIEEGGFLAGQVYRDANRPGGFIVHVTAVLPAERTGASMMNFTFSSESFLRVSQQLEQRGGAEQLLGWYHTHLFAASSALGLSSVDVELHRSTFRRPWQIAALVNITDEGRVLRFYHGVDKEMALVPYWTIPESQPQSDVSAETRPGTEVS